MLRIMVRVRLKTSSVRFSVKITAKFMASVRIRVGLALRIG